MSGHHCAVEDRKADAVAHLAVARSQNTGNGILGILLKRKGSCFKQLPFYNILLCSIVKSRNAFATDLRQLCFCRKTGKHEKKNHARLCVSKQMFEIDPVYDGTKMVCDGRNTGSSGLS